MMSVASSPVYSPSKISLTCKTSPGNLALGLTQQHFSPSAVGAADGLPLKASSSSPFRRPPRGAGCLRFFQKEISPSPSTTSLSRSPASESSCSSPVASSILCGSVPLHQKRKRPARLDVPMLELAVEPLLGSDGRREVVEDGGYYSVYCKRGRKRVEMEDRHTATLDLCGDSQMAFFGIFDGHGGSKASQFASENLGEHILEEALEKSEEIEEAIKHGYLRTDSKFLKENVGGGTCCVTAFVRSGDLIVSNAGDCRAVMSFSGVAMALTSDHRPSRQDEKDRIESLGGYVDCSRAVWRLQGSLAVSRGIGDSHLKPWVIAEPETRVIKIEPECEFLILASDGLWDKVSNQEAVDIARPMCMDPQRPSPLSACKKLVNLSVSRGSMDDVSVMIIHLGHFLKQIQFFDASQSCGLYLNQFLG